MSTAEARGWGDPDRAGYARDHIVTVTAGGVNLAVRREVAPLFAGFCDELAAGGYPLDRVADDWGYANRDIRGRPGVKSNHAWGLAVDLNATTNTMTSDGRTHTDMPSWVPALAEERYGLSWGGDYTGDRRDPMHFEFLGTPADAARWVASLKEDDELTSDQAAQLQQTRDAVARLESAVGQLAQTVAGVVAKLGRMGGDNHRLKLAVGLADQPVAGEDPSPILTAIKASRL